MLPRKTSAAAFALALSAWQCFGSAAVPAFGADSPALLPAVLPGSTAQTQSKMVCSKINWLTSLNAAKEQAKKEHKLIVWIHMLGNIDGFT